MNYQTDVGLMLGIILALAGVAGFSRQLALRPLAKEDEKMAQTMSVPFAAMAKFFVQANTVHSIKLLVIVAGGVIIAVSNLDSVLWGIHFRLMATPIILAVIAALSVTLGELENSARDRVGEYFRARYAEQAALKEHGVKIDAIAAEQTSHAGMMKENFIHQEETAADIAEKVMEAARIVSEREEQSARERQDILQKMELLLEKVRCEENDGRGD